MGKSILYYITKSAIFISLLSIMILPGIGCKQAKVNEVAFQQLISRPEQYSGDKITIEGFFFQGFEVQVIAQGLDYSGYAEEHLVPKGEMIWFDGAIPREVYDGLYQQHMMGPDERFGKIRMTGKFEYGGQYGHLGGYSFKIVPSKVELLEWSPPASGVYTYSFEKDMEGWMANGTDLDNPPVQWSIERSQDMASYGNYSLKLYLDNMNDAGKIWSERTFEVPPDESYHIHIEYDLASSDWGDMNLWTIITGVIPATSKVEPVFQGNTGNNASEESGFIWLHKAYDFNVNPGSEGKLLVMFGVWGTWETARTYYLDNIDIRITSSSEDPTPSTPTSLRVTREEYDPAEDKYGDKLLLTWDANTEADLKEYRIYRSLKRVNKEEFPKIPFALIATTIENTYVDSNINVTEEHPTTIYYYQVSAIDSAGNESTLSEEVSVECTPYG
jgi:hypothetical protein